MEQSLYKIGEVAARLGLADKNNNTLRSWTEEFGAFLSALKSFPDFDTGMGLHINFANIGSSQLSSGLMLKADNSLKWQVLTGRFKSAA